MKKARFGFVITVFLVVVVAGCAAPAATPVPVATATLAPAATVVGAPTVQVIAAGFTPASVCTVPNVVGLDQSMAQGLLAKLGLQPVLTSQYDASIAEGAVISQKPAANTRMEPCKGDVEIIVSLGPIPTLTPRPATATPEATATPANTPTPAPTPTPDNRLFYDDFENGLKPDWHMQGEYTLVNGRLNMGTGMEGYLGDASWQNYAVLIGKAINRCGNYSLVVRQQDRDNYLVAHFAWGCAGQVNSFAWSKMVNGKETPINGAGGGAWYADGGSDIRVEVENNTIRVFQDGARLLYFTDGTFPSGGVGLTSGGASIDSFEVLSLP